MHMHGCSDGSGSGCHENFTRVTRREKKVENFSIIISSRERHHRDLQGTKPFGMTEETLEKCGVADV